MNLAYRVYVCPEGCDVSYVGEFADQTAAIDAAKEERAGLDRQYWATADAAGHVGGMTAPRSGGEEDESPVYWHGDHCVIAVRYS